MSRPAIFLLVSLLPYFSATAATLISTNSTWKFFKGLSEASVPDVTEWRQLDFDDSIWAAGPAAFYYENQPASVNAYTGNTSLDDMFGNYGCIFMRQSFVLGNPYDAK